MSTLSDQYPNLLDVATRLDPDGTVSAIAEIMNKTEEVLEDVPFFEANGLTTHETTARTGIPDPTFRSYYGFVQPTKSTAVKVRDSMCMAEAYGEVDKALADLNSNRAAFIASENKAKIQGFAHAFASTIWYGNEKVTPTKFTGFAPRFNALSTATAKSAANVINGGGSSNCTSIWLINWGEDSVHGIYPKGSKAGLSMQDLGEQTKESTSGLMQVYRQHFRQDYGISVRDWRMAVRACNIDVSALTDDAATGVNLVNLMTKMLERIESMDGRVAFYCNRRIRGFLRTQMVAAVKASTLTFQTVTGPNGPRVMMALDEIPIRRCDSILNTETAVA